MVTPALAWILIFGCVFNYGGVTALRCFECSDVYKPFFCDVVTQCSQGEECFLDQYVTSSGTLLYTSGCRSTQRCGVTKRELPTLDVQISVQTNNTGVVEDETSDIITCSQCCNSKDYCNLDGCGETAIDRASRGPFCFDCSKQGRHSCRHVTQCDVHYSCEITTEIISNITIYNSQCIHTLSSAHCDTTTQRSMPSLIGKRDLGSADVCPKCCDDDFCNEDCTERPSVPVVHGSWSPWGAWSSCSITCGTGTIKRTRTCSNPAPSGGGLSCTGSDNEVHQCSSSASCPVNGGFSDWSSWGHCDVTCGTSGTQLRTRLCNNPVPAYGGSGCTGDSADTRTCRHLHDCHYPNGGYGDWESWGTCPHTCGGTGLQTRHRKCLHSPCTGRDSDSKDCSYQTPCPVNGRYTNWGAWSACSNTCGHRGQHTRYRSCTNPAPAYGGKGCPGRDHDTQHCTTSSSCLSASSSYFVWSAWSVCSRTCGAGGRRQRTKQCYDSAHHQNQSLCTQPILEQDQCNTGRCPAVNGGWSSWGAWSQCPTTCIQGYQSSHRTCTNPQPSGGGHDCSGDDLRRQICGPTSKCNDSGYSTWSAWSTCSKSCGIGGLKSRSRSCSHGRTGHSNCAGMRVERLPCNDGVTCTVKVDGGWGSWVQWSTCSSSCATGQHHRTRSCNQPKPQNGGNNCVGQSSETQACTSSCPSSVCESVNGYHLYTYRTHVDSSSRVNAYLCLHYGVHQHSWSRASQICESEGGHLADFDTWEEDRESFDKHIHNAYPHVHDTQLWIGLTYQQGNWTWEDGRHIGYYAQHKLGTNFTSLPAEYAHGACVLDDGTHWLLAHCTEKYFYICERNVA